MIIILVASMLFKTVMNFYLIFRIQAEYNRIFYSRFIRDKILPCAKFYHKYKPWSRLYVGDVMCGCFHNGMIRRVHSSVLKRSRACIRMTHVHSITLECTRVHLSGLEFIQVYSSARESFECIEGS